jgi:hypothetical protein
MTRRSAVAVALVSIAFLAGGCGVTRLDGSASALRDHFNRQKGRVRLVALVSPT